MPFVMAFFWSYNIWKEQITLMFSLTQNKPIKNMFNAVASYRKNAGRLEVVVGIRMDR